MDVLQRVLHPLVVWYLNPTNTSASYTQPTDLKYSTQKKGNQIRDFSCETLQETNERSNFCLTLGRGVSRRKEREVLGVLAMGLEMRESEGSSGVAKDCAIVELKQKGVSLIHLVKLFDVSEQPGVLLPVILCRGSKVSIFSTRSMARGCTCGNFSVNDCRRNSSSASDGVPISCKMKENLSNNNVHHINGDQSVMFKGNPRENSKEKQQNISTAPSILNLLNKLSLSGRSMAKGTCLLKELSVGQKNNNNKN
ncbi:D-tagatose-1,6-bisphosphate aldolase subunit GatZ [Striga asiatica]|uniref:D-tagatose-1,6-bisphosphate aldolase subunit GatZ n=1 Tax=Striga asiatica TaxID=4170 RepID=A0A5A7PYF3_STRAF|nr:D-tagatose-1,6-bisphosphate aldolase subunit GatZ [Striga asiatica]